MITLRIAWRNVWRNVRRTLLTLLAIAFSTALLLFMFAWQSGSYAAMIRAAVESTTGDLQVMDRDYHEKRGIRRVIAEPGPLLEEIRSMDAVQAAAGRAEAFALADSEERSYGVLVTGVEPEAEARVGNLETIIREGAYFSGAPREILLGRALANNLKVAPGDELVLLGQGRDGSVAANAFTVQGIAESGQPEIDRRLAAIPLSTFQETFFMRGALHRVVVNCTGLDDIGPVSRSIRDWLDNNAPELAAYTWDELMPGLKQSIELDLISGYIFYFLLLVVVAFGIMNTFIMAVVERSAEFGILNAIGTSRLRLVAMLLLETLLLGVCGILAGLVIGIPGTGYLQVHGIVIPDAGELMARFGLPERIHPQLGWFVIGLAPALVMGVTLLSAAYPAIRLLRLNPVKAMHDQ
jgi:ABC-type lipoprotein release transport system permease subunit